MAYLNNANDASGASIFIVEDDAVLRDELANLLELNGYEVHCCKDFAHVAQEVLAGDFDCVILDLTLPGTNGHAICRAIRAKSEVSIIVLTSATDEFHEVMSLNLGANDFVMKPYRPAALLARLGVLVARGEQSQQATMLEHRGLTLDLNTCAVTYQGKESQLTRNEQRILTLLMRSAGTIVSRQEIMCDLWESDAFIDAVLRDELANLLELNGYEVHCCKDFAHVAQEVLAGDFDCVILDLTLPGTNGHAICRAIRAKSEVSIIVLTSATDEFHEVMSLNLGANDFVMKPYRPAALLARLGVLVARGEQSQQATMLEHRGLTLDLNTCAVTYQGKESQLTRNEQRILTLLMRSAGTIVSRQEIMCDLWESDAFIDDNTLTVNINRLRKKLAQLDVPEEFLQTRRSLGYVIE